MHRIVYIQSEGVETGIRFGKVHTVWEGSIAEYHYELFSFHFWDAGCASELLRFWVESEIFYHERPKPETPNPYKAHSPMNPSLNPKFPDYPCQP